MIDDGSNDNGVNICKTFISSYNNIKLYQKEKGGVSSARNVGILNAHAPFVCFVDSDDIINEHYLEYLVSLQEKHNADIVSCVFKRIYSFEQPAKDELNFQNANILIYKEKEILKEYFVEKSNIKIYHNLWNKLYRRELFNDLYFKEGYLHEDLFNMYQLLERCHTLVSSDLVLYYYYRNNANSICKNYSMKNLKDQLIYIQEIEARFKDSSLKDEFYCFLSRFCCNIYQISFKFENTDEIAQIRKELKQKINSIIFKSSYLSTKEKLVILFKTQCYSLYQLIRR